MTFICRRFATGLGLAAVLFASAATVPAFAYTAEQQQACTPDAMRLCGAYIPDVDRITACMIQRRSQLSPECRRFFRGGPAPVAAAGPPTNIKPVVRKPSTQAASAKAKKPKKPAKPADT